MLILTAVMIAIELTICVVKPEARGFALIVLVVGLAGRIATVVANRAVPMSRARRIAIIAAALAAVVAESGVDLLVTNRPLALVLSIAAAVFIGWLSYRTQGDRAAILAAEHKAEAPAAPARKLMMQPGAYVPKERVMVATQGNPKLLAFALKECKSRQAELQILFIRHLAVTPMGPTAIPTLAEDESAQELFERLRALAKGEGVPLRLLYGVARDIPDAILDMAVTHGADLLLLGTTRRGTLWKAMKGDVIQAVAEQLPERIGLLIHA
jgi:nucleotide-binding universal stress UspA family protein